VSVTLLCEEQDLSALWLTSRLQGRGVAVDLVTAAALEAATRWEHRLERGEVKSAVTLPDGRVLTFGPSDALLNRLTRPPSDRIDRVAGDDRDYALQEMTALYLSWLASLPGIVVNRPTPQGLGGSFRHPSHWTALARDAHLPVATWRQSEADDPNALWLSRPAALTVFVVGERVVAPSGLAPDIIEGSRALARLSGALLLGVDLAARSDNSCWEFVGASPVPSLVNGGDDLADAIAELVG
jgi:hypothetical protein